MLSRLSNDVKGVQRAVQKADSEHVLSEKALVPCCACMPQMNGSSVSFHM